MLFYSDYVAIIYYWAKKFIFQFLHSFYFSGDNKSSQLLTGLQSHVGLFCQDLDNLRLSLCNLWYMPWGLLPSLLLHIVFLDYLTVFIQSFSVHLPCGWWSAVHIEGSAMHPATCPMNLLSSLGFPWASVILPHSLFFSWLIQTPVPLQGGELAPQPDVCVSCLQSVWTGGVGGAVSLLGEPPAPDRHSVPDHHPHIPRESDWPPSVQRWVGYQVSSSTWHIRSPFSHLEICISGLLRYSHWQIL